MAKKKTELAFEGKDKEYYEALMHARDIVTKQMQYHAEDALDCTNACLLYTSPSPRDLG